LARFSPPAIIAAIAQTVPSGTRKRGFGEFGNDGQEPRLVHQRQPEVTKVAAVAQVAVMNKQDRRRGREGGRACGAQLNGTTGQVQVFVDGLGTPCSRDEAAQVGYWHLFALAAGRQWRASACRRAMPRSQPLLAAISF